MKLKIIFMGCTKFSKDLLLCLIRKRFKPSAIFTIPQVFRISHSAERVKNYNYTDLSCIAKRHKIDLYEVNFDLRERPLDYYRIIKEISPDIILVLGWYYMVPQTIRALANYGAWGIHASLLPKYTGHAPLVWAIINGEKKTGVTLFRLDSGVDNGDIIIQRSFSIRFTDTIKDVYEKTTQHAKKILIDALKNIPTIKFKPQNKKNVKPYPRRKPEDGKINLGQSALEIYNFIRAQTRPYPGAFSTINGNKIIFWNVRYVEKIEGAKKVRMCKIFKISNKFFIKLKGGYLEIKEVNYNGEDEKFETVAKRKNLLGTILST